MTEHQYRETMRPLRHASWSWKKNTLQRIGRFAPFDVGQLGAVALFPHDSRQM
jgi:hypothetical protein